MHVLNIASEHVCLCTNSQIFTVTYRKPHFFINVNKWILSTPFPHTVIQIHAGQLSEVTGTSLAPKYCSICETPEVRRILCALWGPVCWVTHLWPVQHLYLMQFSVSLAINALYSTAGVIQHCCFRVSKAHSYTHCLSCNVNLQSTFCKRKRKWVMLWHHRNQLSSFYLILIEGCFCCQVIYTSGLP